MELRQYLETAVRWWWLIILSTALAGASTYLATRNQPSFYRTKTTLMIGTAIESAQPDSGQIYMGEQLALTYAQLVKREPVLRGAVESLRLNMDWSVLAGQVSVNLVPQTQLMEISVVDTNPYRAKALADAIAQQLILLTPQARNAQSDEQQFAAQQLEDLKTKIAQSKAEIERLQKERDAAISARRIQDLDSQIATLQSKVSGWQSTYSTLLVYLKGGDVNVIRVVEEAALPTYPISASIMNNIVLAAAIGFALALGGAFLAEYLDDSVKSQAEVEQKLGLPTLGVVARIPTNGNKPAMITATHPRSPFSETYRILRTNVRYSVPATTHTRVILVTSTEPSEGKSTTVTNLAIAMAQGGDKTILVDADLRRPTLHSILNVPNEVGLSSLLVGEADSLDEALQATSVPGLQILTSGPLPPNSAELLGSPRMIELMAELARRADVILMDSPPVLAVTDAAILSTEAMGTILVVEVGRTRLGALAQGVDTIRKVGGSILGVVINRMDVRRRGYYYYNAYYHSEAERAGSQGRQRKPKKARGFLGLGRNKPTQARQDQAT
jgi:polysaccharide biosynthesis transport protein